MGFEHGFLKPADVIALATHEMGCGADDAVLVTLGYLLRDEESRARRLRADGNIRERVSVTDERFRKLLAPTQIRTANNPWWQRGVLAHAGEEYRDDMKRLYNIDVGTC